MFVKYINCVTDARQVVTAKAANIDASTKPLTRVTPVAKIGRDDLLFISLKNAPVGVPSAAVTVAVVVSITVDHSVPTMSSLMSISSCLYVFLTSIRFIYLTVRSAVSSIVLLNCIPLKALSLLLCIGYAEHALVPWGSIKETVLLLGNRKAANPEKEERARQFRDLFQNGQMSGEGGVIRDQVTLYRRSTQCRAWQGLKRANTSYSGSRYHITLKPAFVRQPKQHETIYF